MGADTELTGREATEAAFAEVEAAESGGDSLSAPATPAPTETDAPPPSGPSPTPGEVEGQAAARARDEHGRFTKAGEKPQVSGAPPAPKAAPEAKTAAPAAPPPIPQEAPKAQPALRPPGNWKPLAREKWASLPPEVQSEVHRRESEFGTVMRQAQEAMKGYSAFRQAVGPFEGMIRAEGGEVLSTVQNLLQTAAALRTAPAAHKAQLLANVVRTYGVSIELLDQALAGQAPQAGAAADPSGQYRDPRLDQLLSSLETLSESRAHSLREERAREYQTFAASHDFVTELGPDMADFIDAAAKRGRELSLEDAYKRALLLPSNTEMADILKQREAAEAARSAQASTERTKAAASSVRSQPAMPVPVQNGAYSDPRDATAAAWDEVMSR